MKNFLLFNQSFGTLGSPNQTGETLTRENRIGLMSYLRRTLMLLFAVLVMSVANIGMAWGASVAEGTYNFVDQTIGAAKKFYKIDNGIYQYRLNAYTKNSSLGIQLPASGDGTGFVFHLESTQKVYIGICKKKAKTEVVNNLYIKAITEANFSDIEAGTSSTTVTLSLAGSATLSQNYTFAAIASQKTEGATVYMGELPAGYYYAYGNSTSGNGNLYSITFGTQTLFLVPNDKTSDNAKFAIYYWMGASGYERQGWSDYMTVSPCNSSTYRADIPKGYTKVIFVRLDPNGGRNWDSKWNQTGNLTFDGSKDLFTWANGDWSEVTTTWSASTKYTISFAANGGTGSMSNVSSIACGRSVTLAANAYEKSGYVFAGWKTNVAVTANGVAVAANGIVADEATISNITSNITLTAQWNADVTCTATQPGALSKGTLSGCSRTITASGSAATNNTWYWQSSANGTDKSDAYSSGKAITETGTYYLRSFCSDGAGCWSDAVSVEITTADLTPAAPTALAAASPTAKGATLTVTDAANTNDYEFYVNTSSSAPSAGTSASYTSTSKSVTITDKYAGTTFYAWARAKCGSNKSAWAALGDGGNFTTSTVTVTHTLTNVSKTSGGTTAGGSDYTAVYTADAEYSMPTPTVTIDGNTATSGTDYTWSDGTLTIPANKINGNIVITLNSVPSAPSSAVISGTYHYFPGENISLTVTPTGNNGPTTYQWYKGGKENGNAIEGATSATYTKNSCAFADAGSYYCKVTCNATSIWANTNSSENYDVKILRLYVNGSRNGDAYGNVDFVKVDGTTATASIALGAGWTYGFSVADGCGTPRGNSGTMTENNCTGWTMNSTSGQCAITTTNAATYIFTVNYSNLSAPVVSVTYPVGNQAADKVIYFDNNDRAWTSVYYRIGKSTHSQASVMTKVYGTANLYQFTTTEYNGFSGWHIANATGDVGSGKSIYKTVDGTPITEATAHEGASVTATAVTVTPTSSKGMGSDVGVNDNCEFYNYTITNGMKTDRVTISDYSNGTITVNYTNTSNVASTLTSGYADLAHTVILTSITAVPNTGYDAGAITINGIAYSANYVVTGATTIAATFSPHVYSITYKDQDNVAFSGTHTDTPSAHPTSHTYNTATDLNGATKAGYTFDGWYTTSACTGDPVTSLGATAYTADITLYAKWTAAPAPAGDCGEIIKSTFGGTKNTSDTPSTTTFNTTGEIGGTSTSAIIGDNGKLNSEGAYLILKLSTGTFLAGDTIKISSDKAGGVKFATGTVSTKTYTLIGTASTATSGGQPYYFVLAANADSIIVPRGASKSEYEQNPKITYVSVHRPCPECAATPAAPTAFSAGSITSTEATFSITDEGDAASYDIYYATSGSAPNESTPATTTSTSKTKTVTGLTASTTYYAWVRSVCDASHKSAWVALTGSTFTTTAAPTLYTVTFDSNGGSAQASIEQGSAGASITMPTPTYDDHTFQGWVIGGTTKAAGASYIPTANVTAYASWKANCAGGGSGSTEVYNGENVAVGGTTASGWTINNSSNMTLTSGSSDGYSYWYLASSSTNYVQFDGSASLVAGDQIKIQWTHTTANKDLTLTINGSGASLTSGGHVTTANTKMEAVYDVTSATTVTSIKLKSSGSGGCKIYQVTIVKASGGGCCYVTYNGNGAQSGCISDKTAYTAGEGDVTILGNTGVSAYVKLGYRFNGWNTAANGSGKAYAAGDVVENISNDLTLHAQWVLDACSAPAAPTISGTASRTEGEDISLLATCASGADGSTTYTWYKGVDWATASAASPVQAAMTAGAGGRTFTKATCAAGDAGTYWCKASNGTGCEAHNATGFTVTVSAAVEEHIYYYKDANHYSDGTYSDPEGNTASSGDNKSLSSPWMICYGCKAGVESVVAHGATYDGKGNWVNAYIKLPSGGDASTKNIKFALAAGYTGTLSIKMGKYKSENTLPTASLKLNGAGEAISPTDGEPGGVATTENNFSTTIWNLSTAGGTYILTVSSANAYISQIDMTTTPTATFNVTYNGNGSTGGDVPTDATNYVANTSVTVQAQGTMVKDNYTFGGWNTANNGTGTNYVAGSGTFSIKGATTLYAHWTQTINLAPGTKGTGSLGATVSWNGTAVRGFTAHTATGYSLTGYYTETSGGTKVLNADGSFAATNIDGYITDGKWSRTGAAATLYAQWSGSAIVTNTLGVGSSSKWKSTISTTAPLQITDLSALAAVGGLEIEDANGTSASDRALTCKVEASGATTKTDGEYLQLSFSIAAGYKLRVTGLDVTVRSVGKAGKYHLELVGTTGSLIPDDEQVASGAVNTIFDDAYNVELTGDVTLKLWAYGANSDNKMSNYRLGSPIAIYGAVEETCTPPTFSGLDYSATEYTQGATASAISVIGAENVDSYQWKYSTVNDRTSGTECGTGASVTPSTASTGTLYYWCELTNNTCTTVKTSTVAVTVSALASNPTVTWSNVKLGETDDVTPNYGGGNYKLRATVDQSTWSGTLASSMITAPAGITIHHVTTGTADSKQYIEFHFDVTTAFDREANETIGFHLSLPAISGTPNWNALTSDKLVTYAACDEGEGGMIYIPLTETQTTAASGMKYYWESAGSGRLASQYGGSAMGSTLAAEPYRTADYDFPRYAASTGDKWMFQTYVGGVNKIRVVFRAGGALKSSNLTISKFLYDTEYFSSQGDRQVSIGEVSPSKASFASGEDGYMEFTVPEMAANSYAYFQTGSSNIKIYGIVLYSESSGSGGSVETNPAWSDELENGSTIDKNQGDPNFTYTISTTTNTLGGITYSSSNSSVAEVNATTGEVRITATGESTQAAVITATLARSGCYQPATRTYTVRVAGQECTITSAGTLTADKTSKCELDNVVLSLSGHDTDGTTVTWYRGETDVTGSVLNNTLTTSTKGAYSVVVSKSGCSLRSNTVNITNISAETSATKIVDKWYIKNGRLTPDIALWRLDEGTTFTGVSWSPSNSTGLDFVIREGIVYLEGKEPNFNGSDDKEYTLTLTITDACGTPHSLTDKTITIIHQKNTDKHVLAFVVGNTEKNGDKYVAIGKGFTESIPASQTTNVGLYNEIAKNFDVQATNIYSTDDEQKIKEYYSQFDIICITDYPNTKTKGSHSVSYSDAIGVMVDIRPVLTMEAWVSGLANWNKKGISGDPKSPTTRQYTMLLQCKDHEIFAGTTLTEIGEGDDKMYRIHMVDETQHPYDTLDANYGSGTHESKKGYRYGSYPALQGFTFSQAMEDADLLPLGLIDDGAGKDLQVGLERQHEMSARMMVLGINSTAMERLTADGKRIVINALKYLMKKNAEEIADCSTSFVGGADEDPTNWMNADNWTGNTVPDKTQKVRILAPCVVPEGERPHVTGVLIAPNDGGTYNGGSTPTTGSLTIAAGGALVVDGKIQAVTAPAYNRPRATTPADLAVLTNADAQGALIFDNSEGETQATVQMYSKASGAPNNCTWQWIATPFSNVNRAIEFYYGAWMYEWDNATHAWTQILNDDPMEPFKGYSITQEAAGSYWMNGVLASTENIEQVLRSDEINGKNNGINVIGNSWTAPIQIGNFEAADFTNAHATIFILNTGLDVDGTGAVGRNNSTAGQYISIPVEASALMESTLKVIPAMQAFQVKAQAGGGSLNMDYDRLVRKGAMSQEQIDEPMRAPRRQIRRAARINKAEVEKMHITIRGSRFQDEVYIFAHPDFTEGFDNGWDGEKIRGASEAVQLFVRDATSRWAVAAVPTFVGTYLATYKGEDNEYTISFDYSGDETLYWYDTKTDIYTEINAENTYTYTTDVSTIQTRFMITNENPKLEVPTGVESEKATNTKAVKFIDEDKMYIFVNGKLYDATGKVVK